MSRKVEIIAEENRRATLLASSRTCLVVSSMLDVFVKLCRRQQSKSAGFRFRLSAIASLDAVFHALRSITLYFLFLFF
jgi:hypothetical protein